MSTALHCPRCSGLLEDRDLKGVTVRACQACKGILMLRADLEAVVAVTRRRITQEDPMQAGDYFSRLKSVPEWVESQLN